MFELLCLSKAEPQLGALYQLHTGAFSAATPIDHVAIECKEASLLPKMEYRVGPSSTLKERMMLLELGSEPLLGVLSDLHQCSGAVEKFLKQPYHSQTKKIAVTSILKRVTSASTVSAELCAEITSAPRNPSPTPILYLETVRYGILMFFTAILDLDDAAVADKSPEQLTEDLLQLMRLAPEFKMEQLSELPVNLAELIPRLKFCVHDESSMTVETGVYDFQRVCRTICGIALPHLNTTQSIPIELVVRHVDQSSAELSEATKEVSKELAKLALRALSELCQVKAECEYLALLAERFHVSRHVKQTQLIASRAEILENLIKDWIKASLHGEGKPSGQLLIELTHLCEYEYSPIKSEVLLQQIHSELEHICLAAANTSVPIIRGEDLHQQKMSVNIPRMLCLVIVTGAEEAIATFLSKQAEFVSGVCAGDFHVEPETWKPVAAYHSYREAQEQLIQYPQEVRYVVDYLSVKEFIPEYFLAPTVPQLLVYERDQLLGDLLLSEQLQDCDSKMIARSKSLFPVLRACPNCVANGTPLLSVLKFDKLQKVQSRFYVCSLCETEFCFVCLSEKNDCASLLNPLLGCKTAPRQRIILF